MRAKLNPERRDPRLNHFGVNASQSDQTMAGDRAPRVGHSSSLRAGHLECRRRQRQALLHWAYDSRRL